MRSGCLILLSMLGALGCTGKGMHVGADGASGGPAGSGGGSGGATTSGVDGNAAGGTTGAGGTGGFGGATATGVGGNAAGGTTGAGGTGGSGGATASGVGGNAAGGTTGAGGTGGSGGATATGVGGNAAGGTTGAGGTGGFGGATGTDGMAGQAGGGDAGGANGLSVNPSSATFASTLVEAVSAPQTFTVSNGGNATAGTITALAAAFGGTNAADFLITSNGCGTTLQVGASCAITVAFAPKTRSGSRSASLTLSASLGATADVLLSGTALPSLGLLAGGLGGPGNLDGTGAAARFNGPGGIASDGAGNLYVTDNNAIRKVVIATGTVSTFAGAVGEPGSADGTGAAARFNGPGGIASDGAGNLYVADTMNNTIRKVVIATGAVATLAGVAGTGGASVDGTGATARFDEPSGIVGDGAGNLYVTDGLDDRTVRKVVIATGAVTTLVDGTGAGWPNGIASDSAGNLFLAYDTTIGKVAIATGAVTTLAGAAGQYGSADGTGAATRFNGPSGIASDGAGNLYVADTRNSTIRKVVVATGAVTTLAGSAQQRGSADGTGAAARFAWPYRIASDGAGNLYVTDTGTIRKVVIATGTVTTLAGAAQQRGSVDGTGAAARFAWPYRIASDGAGNLYVTDYDSHTIRKVVIATGAVTTLAGAAGQSGSADGTGAAARFNEPRGIAGDGAGNLYVADDNGIRKVAIATGAVTTLAGAAGTGIAGDGAGNLYVSDTSTIRKVVIATGAVTTLAGAAGQYGSADGTGAVARFNNPSGIASDGAGNLYVADTGNYTIRKVAIATGAVTTLAGAAGQYGSADGTGAAARFNNPSGIASDGAGNLYVADGNTIRKVAIDAAIVSTVIGFPGRVGVSLGALPATLNASCGVVVLPTGELAIVDAGENAVLIGHL